MQRKGRLLAAGFFALAVYAIVQPHAARLSRAGALLAHLSAPSAPVAQITEQDVQLPGTRARWYSREDTRSTGTVVLAHGVHFKGIDEPRLVRFARELAGAGQRVLTPELADIAAYQITSAGIEVLKTSVRHAASQPESHGKTGLVGMSFAGGLSLLAAGDPEVRDQISFVTSVGGHHDLSRVLRFFLSDEIETPAGRAPFAAHEYGLVVLTNQHLPELVEPADQPCLRRALRSWLQEDRAGAWVFASRCNGERAREIFSLLESGRLRTLAPEFHRLLAERAAQLAQLSPAGKLGEIRAPVYLLHGAKDNVIPSSETQWAERELQGTRHSALVTPLLGHVEVEGAAGWPDQLALVGFMARML